MSSTLSDLIGRFAAKRVLVLGDVMLDSYLLGSSTRLCQEAPVPVVAVRERRDCPGGAANTALNLAALGCQVELLSVVGPDHEADRLLALLQRHGVSTDLVITADARQTLSKQRIVIDDALLARVDQGDTGPVPHLIERRLRACLEAAFVLADAVVVSDYSYGVVTPRLLGYLRVLQGRFQQLLCVDARDLSQYRSVGVTVVKPNFEEALRLAGLPAPRPRMAGRADLAAALGEIVLSRAGARIAAITLDADGAVVVERGQPPYRTVTAPAEQARTAGAGDTYLAAMTLALASGASTAEAAEIAASAADVVVQQDGTTTCTAANLRLSITATLADGPSRRGWALDTRRPEIRPEEHDGHHDLPDVGGRQAPALRQA